MAFGLYDFTPPQCLPELISAREKLVICDVKNLPNMDIN